jgi:Putative inner membrane protein (DUF1819)
MSFTTGALFYCESVRLVALFVDLKDWNAVRNTVLADNLLQTRTQNTSKRVCREIISRLKTLSVQELELLIKGTSQEQAYLLWVAICRRYTFIGDFAVEIIRERFISLKVDLSNEDFEAFIHKKSEWHSEIDAIQPSTRSKLRQILFKMLREAELLTVNNTINAALLSPRLVQVIAHHKRQDLLFFPLFESDLQGFIA